jgi:hypothetical protein
MLVALASSLNKTASAADPAPTPNPIGFPKKSPGGGFGTVRIWHDAGVWHLRTGTDDSEGKKDKQIVFSGSVRCDDKISAEPIRLEMGKGKKADSFTMHNDGKGFDFRFATFGAVDQVDFRVTAKAKSLQFKLMLDGKRIDISRIAIGANSEHPAKDEFSLPAQVKK